MSDKEKLLKLIRESRQTDGRIFEITSDLARESQHGIDVADATEPFIKDLPEDSDLSSAMRSWQNRRKNQNSILENIQNIQDSITTFTASGSTVSSTMYTYADNLEKIWGLDPSDISNTVIERANHLKRVIERDVDKNNTIKMLNDYGLNIASHREKTPAESLETAWAAFEKPATQEPSPETYLLPMRACINSVIDLLIKKKQTQESVQSKKKKISSICGQLAIDSLSETDVDDLANRFEELIGELSGAKRGKHSRINGRTLLNRAMLFLQELLRNLDKTKMK